MTTVIKLGRGGITFAQMWKHQQKLVSAFKFEVRSSAQARVFHAWLRTQPAAVTLCEDSIQHFYHRFSRALEDAQTATNGLESAVQTVPEHASVIEPINEYSTCNDPVRLLKILTREAGIHPSTLANFEIRRKLTIAMQILYLAASDSFADISNDVTDINFFAKAALFSDDGVRLTVRFHLEESSKRIRETPLISRDPQEVYNWAGDRFGSQQHFSCRLVTGDCGSQFFIYCASRPKARMSAVIKLERRRKLLDQRGLQFVVVAVVPPGGDLRIATRADAKQFSALSARRLWQGNLRLNRKGRVGKNRSSHPEYEDQRLRGVWLRVKGEYLIEAPVEQQTLALVDYLNSKHAPDTLGHVQYRQKFIRENILPLWFPLEHYGIQW
ncbi:MAG: hypothetical protein AAB833_02105 [Patescibacteria group bacterium]